VRKAWLDHLVLVFRSRPLTDDQLIAFSRQFGELDRVPAWHQYHVPGYPHVLVVSNVTENDKPIGVLGDGEAAWHTDMSYIDRPPTASLLHALEIPAMGGDTYWMNMYAAYEALPSALKRRVAGLTLNHDSSTDSSGVLRPGCRPVRDVSEAPGAKHPLVRRHPETGRPALYLGRRLNAYVMGWNLADSEALLDELWAHCSSDEFAYRHRWKAGDLIMWDNRCTMHRRNPFDKDARRIMHRTEIIGDVPIGAAVVA
jgi:taurine dioxygenase